MTAYFKMLLETSLLCSGIILLIGIFSPLIGKRHTVHWRYFLWIVLSIRLLLPFDISVKNPAVVLPVMPAVEEFQDIEAEIPENILPDKETPEEKDNLFLADKVENVNDGAVSQISQKAGETVSKASTVNIVNFVFIIWALIALLLLVWQTAVYVAFRKKVQENKCFLLKKENIPVYSSSCVSTPMLLGLFHPQILLPQQEYSKEELSFILSHEMSHYQRKDLLVKLLLAGAKTLHWFNPFVYWMNKWACEDIELLCDMQVVRDFSKEEKKSYSEMLLNCAAKQGKSSQLLCSSEFSKDTHTLKKRFSNIFNGNGKKKGQFFAVLGGLAIVFISIFVAFGTQSDEEKVKTPQSTESPKPLISIPELSVEEAANAVYGAVEPQLMYISEKRAVIYDYWGLLIYNVEKQKIEQILDLAEADLCHIQGDTVTHIEVSRDGNQILMYNEPDTQERYVYYIDDKRLEFSDLSAFEGNHYDGLELMEEKGYALDEYGRTACLTMDSLAGESGEAFHPETMQSLSLVLSDRNLGKAYVYPIFQNYYEEKGETALSHRYWKDVKREIIGKTFLYEDKDGWQYLLEEDRKKESRICEYAEALEPLLLVRYKNGKREILDDLLIQSYYMDCPVLFTKDRIVYKAAAKDNLISVKEPVLVSISMDGSDRKTVEPLWHTFDNVCENKGYIYYSGWAPDGTFPRPLCRMKADFSEEPKWVMDLPGLLCGVQDDMVYYKADHTKKPGIWMKNLKTGEEEIYDKDSDSAEELSYFNSREVSLKPEADTTELKNGFHIIMEKSRAGRESYYFYSLPFEGEE